MKYVLDASAVIALVRNEKGCDVVQGILSSGDPCYIHSVNWIEVHYKIHELIHLQRADATIELLYAASVAVPEIPGDDFRRRVSAIKMSYQPLSIGDCHAVALAEQMNATVVTSDKQMSAASGIVTVKQIR